MSHARPFDISGIEPEEGRPAADRLISHLDDDTIAERRAALEAEIARSKAAIDGKSSKRSAADALFNFR